MRVDGVAANGPGLPEGVVPRWYSVTAMFDDAEHAEAARRDLIEAGVPSEDVAVLRGAATVTGSSGGEHGFWETIKELFMSDTDRFTFTEGVKRGGCGLAVRTDETAYSRVIEILDRDGAVDLDEREADWRDAGWTAEETRGAAEGAYARPDDSTAGFGVSAAGRFPSDPPGSTPDAAYVAAAPGLTASPADTAFDDTARPGQRQDARKLGRRDDTHGRTRVRSYIVD